MSSKTKYLTLAILMTLINIPLFIYSQSLAQRGAGGHAVDEAHVAAAQAEEHAADSHASSPHDQPSHEDDQQASNTQPSPAEVAAQALAEEEKPERFKSLATLYRPPLLGKCKKLYERFNRKNMPDKPYKSFVYSFDGETAYCADAYTDKGQQQADEIVMRDCEEHHAGSGKYSPCRIYPAE
jgi:protein required for attachment to host cells